MKTIIPLIPILLEDQSLHLILEAELNDNKIRIVLDTGASRSCFNYNYLFNVCLLDESTASDVESSGIGGMVPKSVTTIVDTFKIGDFVIKEYQSVAIDLSAVNDAYARAGIDEIHGILGGDILYLFKAVIRYDKFELILKSRRKDLSNIRIKNSIVGLMDKINAAPYRKVNL